jgi:hypothetical protein
MINFDSKLKCLSKIITLNINNYEKILKNSWYHFAINCCLCCNCNGGFRQNYHYEKSMVINAPKEKYGNRSVP